MPFTSANSVSLRYELSGNGPALCLISGYRLHGAAWPEVFVERLARWFNVLTFDNRGTGLSDKPAHGYNLDNMAKDVVALLDEVVVGPAHILGFSMGGAIAQELAIRHPAMVNDLVLFATFPGGMFGIPAPWSVLRRLFDIEGRTPEEAARQVWPVTYSPEYLASHLAEVEAQMHREIVHPTPEHAARGQSAAIRAFSSTFRLSGITARTLVATGDADKLVPPGNSRILCNHIPDARLAIFPGLGHRAIWEAPDRMAEFIGNFMLQKPEA